MLKPSKKKQMFPYKGINANIRFLRQFSQGCPPRPPAGQCPCPPPCGPCRPQPPPCPTRPGPIAPNPCCPRFHHGTNTWRKYKMIVFFVGFPLIFICGFSLWGHHPPPKGECRDFEYMRIRTKRFPWHETKSLFHNDAVNFLPGECEPPPLDCD